MFSLLACGHPIRDLANAAKDLIPDDVEEPAKLGQGTTRIALIANLYADAPLAPSFDPNKPEASSSFVVSGSPYASDGHVVDLRVYFAKTDRYRWQWHALATNVGARNAELGSGQLVFGEDGALQALAISSSLRLPLRDGSLSAPLELWLGTPVSADADGFDGVTSTSEPSRLEAYEQDGSAP